MGESSKSDVVIFTDRAYQKASDQSRQAQSPVQERFHLAPQLWVGPLSTEDSEIIMRACSPAFYHHEPLRPLDFSYRQLYSFVREYANDDSRQEIDPDKDLLYCIGLSRIVHPTDVSFEYSATVVRDSNGRIQDVTPWNVRAEGRSAFVLSPDGDWLTTDHLTELKRLFEAFRARPLQEPCSRALWFHEYAAQTYYLDVRWTLIATGLEALIHTDRGKSTRQFVGRLQALGSKVGVAVAMHEAKEMYEKRSSLAHGQALGLGVSPENRSLYEKMEGLLRSVVRRAILDPAFAGFLADRNRVRSKWPV